MKKRGGYLSIVLMILFCGSCRDLFPVQVRQGNFHEVRDSMRVDGKRVLILLASGDCNVCKATKDDWAGDKELVEKLNRDYRVWQLEITCIQDLSEPRDYCPCCNCWNRVRMCHPG